MDPASPFGGVSLLSKIAHGINAMRAHKNPEERSEEQVQALMDIAQSWWLLQDCPPHLRLALCRVMHVDEVAAGRTITTEGGVARRSYFIVEGQVKCTTPLKLGGGADAPTADSCPYRTELLSAGGAFGDMHGPREAMPRSHQAVAQSGCMLIAVEHADYWRVVQSTRDAEEGARKLELLRTMFAARRVPDADIGHLAAALRLQSLRAGQVFAAQGAAVREARPRAPLPPYCSPYRAPYCSLPPRPRRPCRPRAAPSAAL